MKRCVSMLALLLAAAGCEADPVATSDPSTFVATLRGEVAGEYEGSGWFSAGPPQIPTRPAMFRLQSTGRGAARGQGFTLTRPGSELPPVGTYPLGPATPAGTGFTMTYDRLVDGTRSRYSAVAGQVEITVSSPERIEGRFRFSGVLGCRGTMAVLHCEAAPPPAGAPALEASGTFTAVPIRRSLLPLGSS